VAKRFLLRWRDGYTAAILKEYVLVSDEDAWRLKNRPYRVQYRPDGSPQDVRHSLDSGRTLFILGREIMNAKDDEMVLYFNCNPLDCRRSNLRLVKKNNRKVGRKYGERVT